MKHQLLLRCILIATMIIYYCQGNSQWQFIGSPETCESIDFDSEGDTMLVLSTSGLFYSADTGTSWRSIPIPAISHELEEIQIEESSLYITTRHKVLVDTLERFKYDVYRSDDWGENWQLITEGMDPVAGFNQVLVNADTFYFFDRKSMYISYDKGDHYAAVKTHLGIYSEYDIHHYQLFGKVSWETGNGLLRSNDEGDTWDTLQVTGPAFFISDIQSIDGVLWKIEHYPNIHICRVHKSYDDGETWITTGEIDDLLSGFFDYQPREIFGLTGQLYITADGSKTRIYYSADGGNEWINPASISSKDVHFTPAKLFFTSYDGFYSSYDHGITFDTIINGLESATVKNIALSGFNMWVQSNYKESLFDHTVDDWQPLNGFENVEATQDGHLLALINNKAYRSSNQGLDWTQITSEDLGQDLPYPVLYIMSAGDMMFISDASYNLYYSTDYGFNWHKSALTYAYSLNYNGKYLIEVNNEILISNNGIEWAEIPKPEHPDLHFFIDFVYWMEPYYFMGQGNLLLRLHKDSSAWEEMTVPVSDVYSHPLSMMSHNDVLFLTVFGRGVYASDDQGLSWYPVNEGLTNFRSITLSKDEDFLYLGVDGGVWKRRLSDMVVSTKDPERHVQYSSTIITKDIFTIQLPDVSYFSFQLYSTDGKILLQKNVYDSSYDFDLDNLPSGLYYLNIYSPGYHDVRRIMKF